MSNETFLSCSPTSNTLRSIVKYLAICFLVAGICLRPVINGNTAGSGINLFISFFIITAFLLWILYSLLTGEFKIRRLGILEILLGIWGLLVLFSPIVASYKFASFGLSSIWFSDLLLFYLIIQLSATPDHFSVHTTVTQNINLLLYFFLLALLGTGLVISLHSLYQYVWGLEDLREAICKNPSLLSGIPLELMAEFKARLSTNEPFGTFVYQNSLAAFLILLLPIILSLCQNQIHFLRSSNQIQYKSSRSGIPHVVSYSTKISIWLSLLINMLFLLLIVFILLKTGARGAWFACVFSLFVYLMISNWSYLTKRQRLMTQPAFILLLVLLVGIIASQSIPQIIDSSTSSLETRTGYWRGVLSVIKNHFWTGVGLNNLSDHYLIYKDINAGETTKAHNDFLQISAELGILGLISFVGIWLVILFRALRKIPRSSQVYTAYIAPQFTGNKLRLLVSILLGGGIAFLLADVLQAPFRLTEEPFGVLVVAAFLVWAGWILLNIKVICHETIRIGLISGLIAVLIHSLGDFDFYVPGISQSVWLVASYLVITSCPKPKLTHFRLLSQPVYSGLIKGVLIIIILGFITILGFWLIPRLIEYDVLVAEGKNDLKHIDTFSQGIEKLERATQINPYDVTAYYELTNAYPGQTESCLVPLDHAIKLSPMSSGLYFTKGMFLLKHRTRDEFRLQKLNDPTQVKALKKSINNKTIQALVAFQRSYQLYPTRPENAYRVGQVYEYLDQSREAVFWYRRALKLNQEVDLARLKLAPQIKQLILTYLKNTKQEKK